MEDLSFFTNEELISELLTRSTFAGIIIKPKEPLEDVETLPTIQFDMLWSQRLPQSTVKNLLNEALIKIEENMYESNN